jgi:membrane protease YdiL (CAAX protease family)
MTAHQLLGQRPRPGVASVVLRVGLPIAVLAIGLLAAATAREPASPRELTTLLWRIQTGALICVAVVLTIGLLIRLVDRRPWSGFGLSSPSVAWRAFVVGLLAWLLPAGATFAIFALVGMPLELRATAAQVGQTVLILSLAVLISEALPEELVFRGYLTGVLGERLYGWSLIAAQTVLFTGLAHLVRGYTGLQYLMIFVGMGVGLGYLRMVTASVWTAVGFHAGFQTGAQLMLGHDLIGFGGSPFLVTLAVGAIPFGMGATLVAVLVQSRPGLFEQSASGGSHGSAGSSGAHRR